MSSPLPRLWPDVRAFAAAAVAQMLVVATVVLLARGALAGAAACASALCGVIAVWAALQANHGVGPRYFDAGARSAWRLCRASAVVGLFLAVIAALAAIE